MGTKVNELYTLYFYCIFIAFLMRVNLYVRNTMMAVILQS